MPKVSDESRQIVLSRPKRGFVIAGSTEGALFFESPTLEESSIQESYSISQKSLRQNVLTQYLNSSVMACSEHSDLFSILLKLVAPKTEALEREVLDEAWKGLVAYQQIGDEQIEPDNVPHYDFLD